MYCLFPLRLPIWPMDYLEMSCFISTCSRFSYCPSVIDSIMVREHTLYDSSSFRCVEVYFMALAMVSLGECSIGIWKKSSFCFLSEYKC